MIIYENNPKIKKNTEFVLKKIAGAKEGDNIVIIADRDSYTNARAFADASKDFGVNVLICDVDIYGGRDGYAHMPIMEPLCNAINSADIAFMTTPQIKTDFSRFIK